MQEISWSSKPHNFRFNVKGKKKNLRGKVTVSTEEKDKETKAIRGKTTDIEV